MKKLTFAGIAIIATVILIGGIYYFTLPKIEYNNTLFTSQRKKELSQITYWVGDKEKNYLSGKKNGSSLRPAGKRTSQERIPQEQRKRRTFFRQPSI